MSDSNETTPASAPVRSTRAVLGLLGALLGIIVLIVVLVLITTVDFGDGGSGGGADLVDGVNHDRFQAVSLTSGLTYFGKLAEADGDWVVLKDAYYLRNASSGEASTKTPSANDTKYEVVPFADQVGGTGDMRINAREIQVVQDLKSTSPIVSHLKDTN
jgi:hypothetical protein